MNAALSAAFPKQDEPGACLMVARNGTVEELECRGLANLETGEKITPRTTFRLASVTKQFTAAAILLLRQQNRLQLEEQIAKYLPELSTRPHQKITIFHLLQHTSGLLDYEDHLPAGLQKAVSDEDVLKITAAHEKAYFAPGTQFRYSNTGYALLACLVQRITGSPFSLALENLIFRPLGMIDTVVRHEVVKPDVPYRAYGYRRMPDNSFVQADQNLTSEVLGDGGIYCSADDYLKWDRAYWLGQVLPLNVVQEMTTPGHLLKKGTATETDRFWFPVDMNEPAIQIGQGGSNRSDACWDAGGELSDETCEIPYGIGWRLESNEVGLRVAYHPGSSTGFMHCVRHVLDKGLTVLVLANRTVAPSKELAREVEKHLLSR
ncbi:MAG: serine hydrolase domain-containing protein [Candidatus Sumerlaeaceae bacterium]